MEVDRPASQQDPDPPPRLDLRGTPCPVNFIRSRLKLETIAPGAWLLVDLDAGEPERMVTEGLRAEGHQVNGSPIPIEAAVPGFTSPGVRLSIRRAGGA
jgi:TusA-related sulfurtransferase